MRKLALTAIALAGLAGGAGVILSALAAHGTAGGPLLETSAHFLMLHAAAAIAVCGVALARRMAASGFSPRRRFSSWAAHCSAAISLRAPWLARGFFPWPRRSAERF